jgi:ABC-2 type transport system ATP-binding protein
MLALVDLKAAANKKTKEYSLGMKQRLGIALALISDPELLLLDEPTNGLDPNGIIEIRNLMVELAAKHQKTILVSSHLLAEIERVATHVGIINNGHLLFQGTISALQQLNKPILEIVVNDGIRAASFLANNGFEVLANDESMVSVPYTSPCDSGKINTMLIKEGFIVTALYQQKKDLEDLFLEITKNN